MEKFVLIDGNNIVFRSYYALPRLSNFEGVISNGVFGFCNILVIYFFVYYSDSDNRLSCV